MSESRMFPFITETWNPIGGVCPYNCVYCWAKGMIGRYKWKKYEDKPRIIEKELNKKFNEDDFVFVQDMSDLYSSMVSQWVIIDVLIAQHKQPEVKFLHLTKNPSRYWAFKNFLDKNTYLGVTIESNLFYKNISRAPPQFTRIQDIQGLWDFSSPKFVSIEPILDFDERFIGELKFIKGLWGVAVGYDNYDNKLPEPSLEKTMKLIDDLEREGIQVFSKTLRKAWWEE